jgi:hypothetical protein
MSAGFSYLRKNYPIGKSYIRLYKNKQYIHHILLTKDENAPARLSKISVSHSLQIAIFYSNDINNAFLFEESSHCGRESCTF